jgi:hypothetical protein
LNTRQPVCRFFTSALEISGVINISRSLLGPVRVAHPPFPGPAAAWFARGELVRDNQVMYERRHKGKFRGSPPGDGSAFPVGKADGGAGRGVWSAALLTPAAK